MYLFLSLNGKSPHHPQSAHFQNVGFWVHNLFFFFKTKFATGKIFLSVYQSFPSSPLPFTPTPTSISQAYTNTNFVVLVTL